MWTTTQEGVLIIDEHSVIQHANPGAERLFGYPREMLEGSPLALVQPERLRTMHDHGLARYLATGRRHYDWAGAEVIGLHADGSEIPIEISFCDIVLGHERLFVGFIRDVSSRKKSVEALQREREWARSTLRSIGDGVVTTDVRGYITFLNGIAERLTGWSAGEAIGLPWQHVLKLQGGSTGEPLPLALEVGKDAELPGGDVRLESRQGTVVPIEGSIAALNGRGEGVTGWVFALRDVSHARRLAAQLSFQATHDPLTGLVNRTEFERRLRAGVSAAACKDRSLSVLYMDLDQFKIVNDTCGHIAGDELLRQLASILGGCVQRSDTIARLGGDEFGVLLPDCPVDNAKRVAASLCEAVSEFVFVWKTQLFTNSVSIGHVHVADDALPVNEILSKADEACYVAKDLGRNRVHTYEPGEEAQARLHGEMRWVGLIHQAFDEQRFTIHAQPIFNVAEPGAPPAEVEILLRMRHRDGSLVPPMSFLPAAERYNLMPRLDRWVVSEVFSTLRRHIGERTRVGFRTAINISGATLGDATFADFVAAGLAEHRLQGSDFCFEITETAAIANLASAVRLIEAMKALGCVFALDDFGSGLSSFGYLKHLPVDGLKIDGGFVRGIVEDPIDRAMVASINEIGHLMGLRTVAEFVEDEDILHVLREIGVDFAQGYGLARPAPFEDVLRGLPAAN